MQEEYKADGICEDGWDGGVHGGHASQKLVQRRITVHGSVGRRVLGVVVVRREGEQHVWQE